MSAAVLFVFALVTTAAADTIIPPHVAQGDDTDSCAMCHRAHTSASEVTAVDQLGTELNALIVGAIPAEVGDTQLCYTCHGWAGVGAIAGDVQEDFEKLSYHRVAPEPSDYGPSPKQCSTCHDSHGTAKTESGDPYPALLRAVDGDAKGVYQGVEYCVVCHEDRPADVWDGIEIWQQTAHADVTPTASGTEIVCSACHAPHGSSNTALVTELLLPPSAADTMTVPANDRRLCYGCHPGPLATYSGAEVYDTSSHGSTEETVVAATEWATRLIGSEETTRLAGECQVCHSPMGSDDGSGTPIPKLTNAEGTALCYRCHDGELPLGADIASLYPTSTAGVPEIITGYGATPDNAHFGLAQVYARESTATASLPTPRHAFEGKVGPLAAGDIDGDGVEEVLVTRLGEPTVTFVRSSDLAGLTTQDAALLAQAGFIAIGDVLNDTGVLNEVITATPPDPASPVDESVIRAYRWNGATLTMVPSTAATVTGSVSGIAVGDVIGTTLDEVVVTTKDRTKPQDPGLLYIIGGGSGALDVGTPYPTTGGGPQGPSIGDLDGTDGGKGEIAIALGGENNSPIVETYDGDGTSLATGGATGGAAARAQRTLVRDILWGATATGRTGAEVVVTLADPDDGNQDGARVDILPQTAAGGLGTAVSHTFTTFSNPAEMAAGDVDGDGYEELLVARAGSLTHFNAPGLSVVQPDGTGTGISGSDFYPAAGVEAADSGPGPAWVAIADIGAVGRSKHAVGAIPRTHVSTETPDFTRHVECVDCHNVHEATSTPAPAPLAYGSIRGTWGVSVENAPVGEITYTEKRGIEYEYELCLKCHSGWSPSDDTTDIAALIDTRNASVHAIEAPSTTSQVVPDTFVTATPAWGNDSVLHCVNCHGNSSSTQAVGPHVSAEAPLLTSPYWGTAASDSTGLCFDCHRREVFFTGDADPATGAPGSRFWQSNNPRRLHRLHGLTNGLSCAACHTSHGSTLPHLIRTDVGFAHVETGGGSCTNACHGDTNSYSGR